jgi:hypothetical protein
VCKTFKKNMLLPLSNRANRPKRFSDTQRLCRLLFVASLVTSPILAVAAPQRPTVADQIRKNKPALASPLLQRLRDCRIKVISPTWADYSFDIDSEGTVPTHNWAGMPAYDTPVQLDPNTIAVVLSTGGQRFSVWHIDVPAGKIIFKVEVDGAVKTTSAGPFESVSWHRINNEFVAEFVSLAIEDSTAFVGPERAPRKKYDGESLITRVNLSTGSVETVRDTAKKNSTEDRCRENLTKKQLHKKTSVQLPPPASVTENIDKALASRGLLFDFKRGRFLLTPAAINGLKQAAGAVAVGGADSLAAIKNTQQMVRDLPTCAGTRDLAWQLALADAVATENVAVLDEMCADRRNPNGASDERRSQMRNLAAFQRLHFVAAKGDRVDEYEAFARRCDNGIAARDSAILRTHELRFLDACEQATVAAFDDFVAWVPFAIQSDDATRHAYDLKEESIRLAIADNVPPEEIARDLYNDWRTAVRTGHTHKAKRSFNLLTEQPAMRKTHTSIQAQDTKDNEEFRALMLAHAEKNGSLLSNVIGIQQQQLTVMSGQLLEQSETNARLNSMGSQLQHIEYSGQRAASGIESLNRMLSE